MTFDQRMAAAKPYITGFVIGVIAAPIVAFSAGWVSTSGARAEAVQNARVEALVGVCSANVQRMVKVQNTDLATLKGYQNRDARNAVIAAALTDVHVPDDLSSKVTSDCSRTLS